MMIAGRGHRARRVVAPYKRVLPIRQKIFALLKKISLPIRV